MVDQTETTGVDVLERLPEQPGGPELLELTKGREDIYLVGGAVRDLLLGRAPRELDVVVVGGSESAFADVAPGFAAALAARLGIPAGSNEHERFGTAILVWEGGRIDIATARRERYPSPGALPQVEAAPLQEDLSRRDFTVNAIAVALAGSHRGELHGAPHALEDLHAGCLRVLHEQSFSDDPTRLLRLARYRERLGFAVEEHTAELARRALSEGALGRVSGARIGAELRLALGELRAPQALEGMRELGILAAVHPRLRYDPRLVESALALLPRDGSPPVLLLAALLLSLTVRADGQPQAEARALLDRLEFPAGERDRAVAAALAAVRLLGELAACARPADIHAAVAGAPIEGVALAGALGAGRTDARETPVTHAARRWLDEIRHVHLQITGEDLLAAGVPQGPDVGRRLRETLLRRLDGELGEEREAQLSAALELP
jgi:tRNA nucleotidyltransferase (CCA-adding enzyme)